MASFPDVDEVSSMLERSFTEIHTATEALDKLNRFLRGTDVELVEKLLSQLAESSVVEKDCLHKLSRIMQEGRVVDFLGRAGQRIGDHVPETGHRRLFHSFVNEYFDASRKEALGWLTEDSSGCSVLLMSGSSSIGINDFGYGTIPKVEFDPRYWIDVSGMYKMENFLETLKKKKFNDKWIEHQIDNLSHARSKMELIDQLMRHSVKRNRYMFVFDKADIHQEFWHVIKTALHDNDKRDWIITTTPIDRIVNPFKQVPSDKIHKLGPLSDVESWKLFCSIAFYNEPGRRCPPELRRLLNEIVKMCRGFQLPILGIAGLLSKRGKQESEWERVRNSFQFEVKTNQHLPRTLDVPTRASIRDLPEHLSRCFMYFGIFPVDSVIPNTKLYKLWIAEGFVQENGEKALEEVAEEYLNELIRRGLVHSYQGHNRFEEFCRVDRLMHSAIYTLSYRSFFFKIFCEGDCLIKSKSPRLSICTNDGNVHPRNFSLELHSLFVFGCNRYIYFMTELISRCELLMVLDFEYHPIEQLPEEFGKLINLKYLSLKNTKLRKLPKSVEKLVNLQTLDVRNTLLLELPVEISMLTNLRHLLASVCDDGICAGPTKGVRLKKGIGSLRNLQTLTTVDTGDRGIGIIIEIWALKQLRTLGVSGLAKETVNALCACIDKLVLLKSLSLKAKNGNEVLNLVCISSELPLLQRLVLKGQFHNIPNWIFCLQNLSVLCLSRTQLTVDQLTHLSHLPNLVTLWLCRVYKGARLYFNQGSFEKLKLLVLREFHGLHELEIEDGALSCLEELRIGSSPFLDEVPSGIQYLKNLKILINYDMPNEFVVRMQPNGGSDYWKVKHIPSVFFLFRVQGRKYKMFELGERELLDHLLGLATNAYHATEPQDEHEFTFFEEDSRDVNPTALQIQTQEWSFTSSMFTDDVEM